MEADEQRTSFVPFTKAERIQQLGDIDKKIVSLARSTGQAMQCLGKRIPHDGEVVMTDTDPIQQYKDSMDEFMGTLRTVNVGMKRQIWGLEEAGIISLGKKELNLREEGGEVQASNIRNGLLEPDGNGKIGGLDVGWLNSRSNKVEKDMEADLWREAEDALQQLLAHQQQYPDERMNDTAS
ncbi:putative mediator complex protein [Rosellinia necatrix]|uniref:Mediator of RNA polymerase II transcription subunit 11 n=1 Tax=Rosellinia necatrix TaxID=77044 RepID=A0A1W2TVH5_ROSNE|nr:putative mediator complex protein [Rosellinia necatrix]